MCLIFGINTKALSSRSTISIFFMYIKCACVYVGLKVLHAACII